MGSFGNVLIYRVPEGKTINGRSMCPHCHRVLRAWELVPVLSFLVLGARCARCKIHISLQYPLVELFSALLFLLAFRTAEFQVLPGLILGIAFWLLLIISIVDMRSLLIPDAFNLPFVGMAALYALITGQFSWWAVGITVGFFGAQWVLSRGRALGSGDVILAVGTGLLQPDWPHALFALLLAYVLGSVVAVYLLVRSKTTFNSKLAFGPFIAIGAVLSVVFGQYALPIWGVM